MYTLPDGEFGSVATRFGLPVRALSYSPSGTNLAAAGDDEGIKLISASESKVLLHSASFSLSFTSYTSGLPTTCALTLQEQHPCQKVHDGCLDQSQGQDVAPPL